MISEEGIKAAVREYTLFDWETVVSEHPNPSNLTAKLHDVTEKIFDKHLPWKTRKIKSTDDPWTNNNIRTAIKRRKRTFRKQGRSKKGKALKARSDLLIAQSKAKYYR